MSGYSATIEITRPQDCPIADVSTVVETPVDGVVRSARRSETGTIVEEFSIDADEIDLIEDLEDDHDLTRIHSTGPEAIYRFERECREACACDLVELSGTPVSSIKATDGTLSLSVRTIDVESIAAIVDELRNRYDSVVVRELTQSPAVSRSDPIVVDRGVLTDRQREVLATAYEMGYYEYPKRANASDVAEALEISRSTFTEHLGAAQTKLLRSLLES